MAKSKSTKKFDKSPTTNSFGAQKTMPEFVNSAADRSLDQALSLVDAIAQNPTVELAYRAKILRGLVSATKAALFEVLPKPSPAGLRFKDRHNKRMSATEFVASNFPDSFGTTLQLSDIRKFDEYLYQSLLKERRENGGEWPFGFNLQTISEHTDELLGFVSENEIQEMMQIVDRYRERQRKRLLQ